MPKDAVNLLSRCFLLPASWNLPSTSYMMHNFCWPCNLENAAVHLP